MSKKFVKKYYEESYSTGDNSIGYQIYLGEEPDMIIGEGGSEELAWADAALSIIESHKPKL